MVKEGYYVGDGSGIISSPCNKCRHRISATKCNAFSRIPNDILKGKNDHHKPYEGDHGIQFSERKGR